MKRYCVAVIAVLATALVLEAQQGGIDPFRPMSGRGGERGVIASAEFVDTEITAVFKMISDMTGWSIITSPDVSKTPPKIDIWIKNLTPQQLLDEVTSSAALVVERKGSTVHVSTFDEYARMSGLKKEVIQVRHAGAEEIANLLKPFIDEKQAKVLADPTGNKLVLLVPEPLLKNLIELTRALDLPFAKDAVSVVRLKHLEAETIVPALEEFLTRTAQGVKPARVIKSTEPPPAEGEQDTQRAGQEWLVRFMVVPKLNAILLRGLAGDIQRAVDLIAQLDVPTEIEILSYQLQYTTAPEVLETIQDIVAQDGQVGRGKEVSRRLRVSASEQNNRIVVEGTAQDHRRISRLIAEIDQPLPPGSGGIRVYRLENASSSEVAGVLQGLVEEQVGQQALLEPEGQQGRPQEGSGTIRRVDRTGGDLGRSATQPPGSPTPTGPQAPGRGQPDETAAALSGLLPVTITEAPEINAVVIRASAAAHEELASIIRELDKPRDQALLEVTLVVVRSTEGFDLGVELGGARVGEVNTNIVGFTDFGIAGIDLTDPSVTLPRPAPVGFNFAVFNAGDFSLVINALKTLGDIRITSAPKILVLDNAEAQIRQINEEPFEVTTQGETTTLTSFGGFVNAGTTLNILPHISGDDSVRLEYQVGLSSFDERNPAQLAANLPPPRRETTSQGTVRVPAEHLVVLGGLVSTRDSEVESGVPILSEIPWLGEAFKARSSDQTHETLFIFIRPVVLRDPSFRDLLFLSEQDVEEAQLESDEPVNALKIAEPQRGAGEGE